MAGHGGNPLAAPRPFQAPPAYYFGILKKWTPSLMTYGAFSGMMFLYFTDWKLFMDKVPFYNKKFQEKEPIV